MTFIDFTFIVIIILAILAVGLYFLNKKLGKRMTDAQGMIEQTKQQTNIYVIDKKKDKITNVNMPKMVVDQVPSYQKILKNYFVKAKIGPQIVTLMCDKNTFNAIPVKKNVKVELAGIYIVSVVGMKSKAEMKEVKKQKKEEAKAKSKEKK